MLQKDQWVRKVAQPQEHSLKTWLLWLLGPHNTPVEVRKYCGKASLSNRVNPHDKQGRFTRFTVKLRRQSAFTVGSKMAPEPTCYRPISCDAIGRQRTIERWRWELVGHLRAQEAFSYPWRGLQGIGLLSLFAFWPLGAEQLAPTVDSPPQLMPYDGPKSFRTNLRVKPPTLRHCGPKLTSFHFHQPIISGLVIEDQHGNWKEDVEEGCKTSSGRKQIYESAHLQTRAILHEKE